MAELELEPRQVGLAHRLHGALMRWLQRTIGLRLFIVQLGDDHSELAMPALEAAYVTRAVALEELLPWADRVTGLSLPFLRSAIARGDRCVANFYRGELVGFGFVTTTRAPAT